MAGSPGPGMVDEEFFDADGDASPLGRRFPGVRMAGVPPVGSPPPKRQQRLGGDMTDPTVGLVGSPSIPRKGKSKPMTKLNNGTDKESVSGVLTPRPREKPSIKLNLGGSVNLSNLAELVEGNAKIKPAEPVVEYDFVYTDTDTFVNELNELYSYDEVPEHDQNRLHFLAMMAEEGYGETWEGTSKADRRDFVELCLNAIETENTLRRRRAAQSLLYLAQGNFGECSTQEQQLGHIHANSLLLLQANCLPPLVQCVCGAAQGVKNAPSYAVSRRKSQEMRIFMNIIYTVVMSVGSTDRDLIAPELVGPFYNNQPLFMVLYRLILEFAKPEANLYPIRKLVLLMWKVLLYGYGGTKELAAAKQAKREAAGLRPFTANNPATKARPAEVATFKHTALAKYYGYFRDAPTRDREGRLVPPPVEEGLLVLRRHLYWSYADYQFQKEAHAPHQKKKGPIPPPDDSSDSEDDLASSDWGPTRYTHRGAPTPPRATLTNRGPVDNLYELCLPDLSQFVILLLKIMLASVPNSKNTGSVKLLANFLDDPVGATAPSILQALQSSMDVARHKEIIMKAVSATILLLLKHFKNEHILQFEHLSDLIVGANGLLLKLKILNHNLQDYITAKNVLPYCEFFEYTATLGKQTVMRHTPTDKMEPTDVTLGAGSESGWYCWRNFHAIVSTLRILQKITKGRHARVMVLIQYKAPAVLKRALRVQNESLQLYCLKLIKSQTRFLTRKWRSTNMRIMSGIYHLVHNTLADEWVYKMEADMDFAEAQKAEGSMRTYVQRFNEYHYEKAGMTVRDTLWSALAAGASCGYGKGGVTEMEYEHWLRTNPLFVCEDAELAELGSLA